MLPRKKSSSNEANCATMKLLTQAQRERMLANGRFDAGRERTRDFQPVVKLYR
jgi:hypothetical protein